MITIKFKIPFISKIKDIFNSSLANPQEWLLAMLNRGTETNTGIPVSEKSAIEVSAVFSCIKVVSETIAYLSCILYKRTKDGKYKATDEKLFNLLKDLPNNSTTAFDFWVMYIVNLLLTGDAFAYLKRNGNGQIMSIYNIPSKNVTIYKNPVTNEYVYAVKDPLDNNKESFYYPENIMHTRGMRFDDENESLNPIKVARETIGLDLALEKYASKYFGNGAQAGGVVEYPEGLSDKAFERFRDDFRKKYSGVANSNKIMFLENGAKFNKITNNPDESQAVESRQFQVIQICRFFGVPPHKVMDLSRATFSNIEQQNIDFIQTCIGPKCKQIEQTIYKDCLSTTLQKKTFFAKFNTNSLLRGDVNARREYYNTMVQNGVYSPNDVRELEDKNPYEGGNVYMVNGNMIPVNMVGQQFLKGGEINDGKNT